MIAILIPTYNRPEYLQRCLDSLSRVTFPDDMVIMFIDDSSTDEATKELINGFALPLTIIKHFNVVNVGIKSVLKQGYDFLFQFCDTVINLDSDAIVKPEFITRLLELKQQFPDHIVSGFNSHNKDGDNLRNPIISEHDGYALKQYANGINMVISKEQYKELSKSLGATGNWDFNFTSANKLPKVIAVPSLVQHIGMKSSMGHTNNPDVASDFKLLAIPDVTLFGIDNHDPKGLLRAAEISTRDIEFGAVTMITEKLFTGREGYSRFCIESMASYIETSHVLIIHADGYVQNPLAWDNEWLQYDYIGATWWYKDGMNNGNGGFCLRSKKLLDILASLDITDYHPEDDVICRQLRPWLEDKYGIKFAPDEVCNKFSIEAFNVPPPHNKYNGQFGFHGYHVSGLPYPIPFKKIERNTMPNKRRLVR